ncbi:MAG: DUF3159 domain-containing protein [Halanaerobium sp.]
MKINFQEIIDELKNIFLSTTFDALLPPLVYAVTNSIFSLNTAVIFAIITAFSLWILRIIKKQNWKYSIGGLIIVITASGLAFITKNANNYFIPGMINSSLFFLTAVISILLGRPIAALASHLSRSWPLDWFWRKDIKPAYREVTIFWAVLFLIRLTAQIILYRNADPIILAWANTLLGWPFTILILIISYIYGIWRLRKLGGPGVEEFKAGKEPPWDGQKRGF